MNSTELSLSWKKCSDDEDNPNDYVLYVDNLPFNMFYLKGETDLDSVGHELADDDPEIETIINSGEYMYNYFNLIIF